MNIDTIQNNYSINDVIKNPLDKIGKNIKDIDKINQLATDYEAFFLAVMLEQMHTGIKAEKPFSGGNAETTFRSILIQAQAQEFAETNPNILAPEIKKQIIQIYQQKAEQL